MAAFALKINGQTHQVDVDPNTPPYYGPFGMAPV